LGIEAAADEVHDFQTIPLVQLGFGPATARNYLTIQFHGHAIGFHAEGFYEACERERDGGVFEIALFPVNVEFHVIRTFVDSRT